MATTTLESEIRLTTDAAPVAGGGTLPTRGNSDFQVLARKESAGNQSSAEAYKCGVHVDSMGKNWSRNRRSWCVTAVIEGFPLPLST